MAHPRPPLAGSPACSITPPTLQRISPLLRERSARCGIPGVPSNPSQQSCLVNNYDRQSANHIVLYRHNAGSDQSLSAPSRCAEYGPRRFIYESKPRNLHLLSMNLRCILLLLVTAATHAKEFVNLGFDSPDLSNKVIGAGGIFHAPTTDLLPGWELTAVGGPAPTRGRIGVSGIPFSLNVAQPVAGFDFGTYRVFLGPRSLPPTESIEYHLSQTGQFPLGASYLRFFLSVSPLGTFDPQPRPVDLLINGVSIAYSRDTSSITYHADVSAYAGQEVDLEFVFIPNALSSFDIAGIEVIPEPSTSTLIALGAGSLALFGLRGLSRRP
jgi:hypothetical protein